MTIGRNNRVPRRVSVKSRHREASMDQRIINLYDRFTHGALSRRDFLDRLA